MFAASHPRGLDEDEEPEGGNKHAADLIWVLKSPADSLEGAFRLRFVPPRRGTSGTSREVHHAGEQFTCAGWRRAHRSWTAFSLCGVKAAKGAETGLVKSS